MPSHSSQIDCHSSISIMNRNKQNAADHISRNKCVTITQEPTSIVLDIAALIDARKNTPKTYRGGALQFPWMLHKLLEESETNNTTHIISWLPCGRVFKVHDKALFLSDILPKYVRQSKYKSFVRSLNLWGFTTCRQCCGKERRGAYFHPNFVQGNPKLSHEMVRIKVKSRVKRDYKACGLCDFDKHSATTISSTNSVCSSQRNEAVSSPVSPPQPQPQNITEIAITIPLCVTPFPTNDVCQSPDFSSTAQHEVLCTSLLRASSISSLTIGSKPYCPAGMEDVAQTHSESEAHNDIADGNHTNSTIVTAPSHDGHMPREITMPPPAQPQPSASAAMTPPFEFVTQHKTTISSSSSTSSLSSLSSRSSTPSTPLPSSNDSFDNAWSDAHDDAHFGGFPQHQDFTHPLTNQPPAMQFHDTMPFLSAKSYTEMDACQTAMSSRPADFFPSSGFANTDAQASDLDAMIEGIAGMSSDTNAFQKMFNNVAQLDVDREQVVATDYMNNFDFEFGADAEPTPFATDVQISLL